MFRIGLEAAGFETGLAAEGQEALRRLRAERFDIVLLDVMMPVLDGWSVLEALREDPAAPPVLVISARHGVQYQDRAIELGAVGYITKPVDLEALAARIATILEAGSDQARSGAN
jgi:two-component system, OmpR family, copper resistance phosphate regulon response regulator CusR